MGCFYLLRLSITYVTSTIKHPSILQYHLRMHVHSLREGPGVSCSGSMIRLVGRLISLFVDGLMRGLGA